MSTDRQAPALDLGARPGMRAALAWLLLVLALVVGLSAGSELPSPAGPLIAWAGILGAGLIGGGGVPVTFLGLLFAVELLRALLVPLTDPTAR